MFTNYYFYSRTYEDAVLATTGFVITSILFLFFVFVFYSLVKDQNIPGKKEINNQSGLLAVILFHRFLPHPTPKIETETERVCVARSVHTHVVMYVIVVDLFCIVLFSILKQTPCTLVISCNFLNESH